MSEVSGDDMEDGEGADEASPPKDWTKVLVGSALTLFNLWRMISKVAGLKPSEEEDARRAIEFEETQKRHDERTEKYGDKSIARETERWQNAEANAYARQREDMASEIFARLIGDNFPIRTPINDDLENEHALAAVAVRLADTLRGELTKSGQSMEWPIQYVHGVAPAPEKPGEEAVFKFTAKQLGALVDDTRRATQRNTAQLYFQAGISQVPAPTENEKQWATLLAEAVKYHNAKLRADSYEEAIYDVEQMLEPTNAALPEEWERRKRLAGRLESRLQKLRHS